MVTRKTRGGGYVGTAIGRACTCRRLVLVIMFNVHVLNLASIRRGCSHCSMSHRGTARCSRSISPCRVYICALHVSASCSPLALLHAPPCAAPRLHLLASVSLHPRIYACMHLYKVVLSSPLPYADLILSALCKCLLTPTFDALVLCVVVCISSTERGTGPRSTD